MSAVPSAKEIMSATAVMNRLGVSRPAHLAVFTPQPYPLFLADWSEGKPLVGRVVGWSAEPARMPHPVVVFEDGGASTVPLVVNMLLGMGGGGPMWLRDTAEDALAAAKAYIPPADPRSSR